MKKVITTTPQRQLTAAEAIAEFRRARAKAKERKV
jgi:hypothetical protein|tara:strand:+ start:1687 stop:1791 length:105 start_codon:yes stop_codon:yes gene_type:complete